MKEKCVSDRITCLTVITQINLKNAVSKKNAFKDKLLTIDG